jgi:hypothetical protein
MGCGDIKKALALGFAIPDDTQELWEICLEPPWDTITQAWENRILWQFVPLRAFLRTSMNDPNDRSMVRRAIIEKGLPLDSMWIDIRSIGHRGNREVDPTRISLDLFHYSGVPSAIATNHFDEVPIGNAGGQDGTLIIDRSTGKSTYGLWQ